VTYITPPPIAVYVSSSGLTDAFSYRHNVFFDGRLTAWFLDCGAIPFTVAVPA
jgi:hypothetical protein